jgi:hypothetical protein
LPYLLEYLQAVDPGQLQIQKGHHRLLACVTTLMGADSEEVIQGLPAVPGKGDRVEDTVLLECPKGQGRVVRIVFHEQDGLFLHVPLLFLPKV